MLFHPRKKSTLEVHPNWDVNLDLAPAYVRNSHMYNTFHMEMQGYVNKSKSKSDLIPTTTSLYGKQVQPEGEKEYSQTFASAANKCMHDTAQCKRQ